MATSRLFRAYIRKRSASFQGTSPGETATICRGWGSGVPRALLWAAIPRASATAAAAVQHGGILRDRQKPKAPVRQGTMAQIHHGDHQLPAKSCGPACILKKGHGTAPLPRRAPAARQSVKANLWAR